VLIAQDVRSRPLSDMRCPVKALALEDLHIYIIEGLVRLDLSKEAILIYRVKRCRNHALEDLRPVLDYWLSVARHLRLFSLHNQRHIDVILGRDVYLRSHRHKRGVVKSALLFRRQVLV